MRLVLRNPGLELRIPDYDDLERMEKEDAEGRPQWDNKAQYILTCVGFCIGLGNVWRFPYLCQSHGGGAFLIPYLILLVLEGMPLLLMEFAIGQRLRKGSVGVWSAISPYLTGVGIASMLVSFLVALYYNTLIAWILWYLLNSFQQPLPWAQCPLNENGTEFIPECQRSSTVDYFFYRETLNSSASISESEGIQWPMVVCLLGAWTIVAICCVRGISTSGKAVYVTAILPYIVLAIFLIRGATLKGAVSGIKFLFTPDAEELIKPTTWLDAGAQLFYAFGLAWGGLISFSSYNPVHNNCVQDAVILSVVTGLTSIYAALVTYSIIGFRATEKYDTCISKNIVRLLNTFDLPEDNITSSNYDAALNHLNSSYPHVMLGLNLQSCDMQKLLSECFLPRNIKTLLNSFNLPENSISTTSYDAPFNHLNVLPRSWPHEALTRATCIIAFIICLLFAQPSGLYRVTLFDNFLIAVVYVYGINRFISPLIILVILVFYLVTQTQKGLTYFVWDRNFVSTLQSCRLNCVKLLKSLSLATLYVLLQRVFCIFLAIDVFH
uniref:Transporter n=1 Tax=Poecilia latipinna TaxID=48699 RepID=A0A3B3TK88_9TELE